MQDQDALAIWLHDHRAAHPQGEAAWIFLRRDTRRDVHGAFEVLRQQWLDAVYAIRESRVAATKLQWWLEELHLAAEGRAKHPLTQALFADEQVRGIPAVQWQAAIVAAFRQLEIPPAGDFAAQLEQAGELHGALARIETSLWFGVDGDARRMQALAMAQHLLVRLRNLPLEVDHGRTPLPMSLLARHGLSQDALLKESPARNDALHDQAGSLKRAMDAADKLPGPLSLFRGFQRCQDGGALRRALRAQDPLRALQRPAAGIIALRDAWSAARACQSALRA